MTHRKHKRANYPQRLTDFDCDLALRDKAEYELQLDALQLTMLKIQQAYFTQGRRAIIVMEGTDGSGKGGIIGRLVQPLDPRGIHVWPIGAPTSEEKGHHYLYRFWQRLPSRGSLAVFDRSWYGRVSATRASAGSSPPTMCATGIAGRIIKPPFRTCWTRPPPVIPPGM